MSTRPPPEDELKRALPIKVLFLAANARDTTRLAQGPELRDLQDVLRLAGAAETWEVKPAMAVRPADLQSLLLAYTPDVVHFSGHGANPGAGASKSTAGKGGAIARDMTPDDAVLGEETETDEQGGAVSGIVLEDDDGRAVIVEPEALTRLFEIVQRQASIRVAVLNACFMSEQAWAIAKHIDCVVGTRRAIDDRAAVAFATGFHRALARGRSVKDAFDFGCNEVALRGLPDRDVPQLHHRPGVDPAQVFVRSREAPERPPLFTRSVAAVAGVLLVVLVVLGVSLPLVSVPESGTIVVAGSWLSGSVGRGAQQSLCDALDRGRVEGEGVACLTLPLLGGSVERVRRKAMEANASLLVYVEDGGSANLLPLGSLADHELLGQGLPAIDISAPGAAEIVAPALWSLAHLATFRADMPVQSNRIRCPKLAAPPWKTTALLFAYTTMYSKSCPPDTHVWKEINELVKSCLGDARDNVECKIAYMLCSNDADHCSSADRSLAALRGVADPHVQPFAKVKAARTACREGRVDEAERAAIDLWLSADACERTMASVIAACLLHHRGNAGEDRGGLRAMESFAGEEGARLCGREVAMRAIGERAWWRALAGRWSEAAADYGVAWEDRRDPQLLLNLVEVLLHQDRDREAEQRLKALAPRERLGNERDEVHRRLLTWVLQRRQWHNTEGGSAEDVESAVELLVDEYRDRWPHGEAVFADARDPVLRPLVCRDGATSCACDVLARPKSSGSADRLRAALESASAAGTPSKP